MKHYMDACRNLALLLLVAGTALRADMMADSPVTFPEKGALPSKHPPDRRSKGGSKPEEGYFFFETPQRSLEQIAKIREEMAPGTFTPPPTDWKHLARTRKALTGGGDVRILAVGDSIVNDTMRSAWVAKLREAYPKGRITANVYVRGGGGCQHYREEKRVQKVVIPAKPNLVLIGGISQKSIDGIRDVIHQIRKDLPDTEFLLFTGSFGSTDPRDADAMAKARHSGTGEYGSKLKALATEERCAFLDMTTPWVEYILSAKVHPHTFYRDRVHANEYGEQILSKIMMAFWTVE